MDDCLKKDHLLIKRQQEAVLSGREQNN